MRAMLTLSRAGSDSDGPTGGRRLRRLLLVIVVGVCWLAFVPRAAAQSDPVVKVEEDWLLLLNEPNEAVNSPQFYTTMTPYQDLEMFYAQVTWNYQCNPDFQAGGLQMHSWYQDMELRRHAVGNTLLSTTAETITWTQALELSGPALYFDIKNGHSTTWGDFGKDMHLIWEYANLTSMDLYDPAVSVVNSGISYGSNRVNLLMITEVRWYGPDNVLLATDSTPRVVYMIPPAD